MSKTFVIVTDKLGAGHEELGRLLMKNMLYALARENDVPAAVVFMNHGVKLACAGSESLDDLALLVEKGVAVASCGTCLDYLGLKEALAVGEVGTMPDTVHLMSTTDAVVVG